VKSVGHNPLTDPNSNLGTYPVSVQITNSDEKLQPGMSADVTLNLETKENVIVIPLGAVRSEQGQDYVDVSKAGLSIKRKVKLGLVNDVSAEVVEGLAEGESVRMP
jgi:multidrug efflux pump subunit AcrA (membrane-fusion protein)